MTKQLRFFNTIPFPDNASVDVDFVVDASSEGVSVTAGMGLLWDIPWDKVDDVEYLAEIMWALQVWRFKEVVRLLAMANQVKHMFQ
jgi:hypothetical protein